MTNEADQTGRTGSIVNVAKPLVQFDAGGKWVTVDITAKGPHMVATLNGIKTAEADDAKLQQRAGVIASRGRHRALSQRPDTAAQVGDPGSAVKFLSR
mgnify:CR=1 FL=1